MRPTSPKAENYNHRIIIHGYWGPISDQRLPDMSTRIISGLLHGFLSNSVKIRARKPLCTSGSIAEDRVHIGTGTHDDS